MAVSRTLSSDPLRNFKFLVSIQLSQNLQGAQPMASLGFMQAQGLGISISPLTYREGGDNVTTRKLPGQADFNPITLTQGLFPNQYQMWYWISELFTVLYGTGFNGNNQPAANPPYVVGSQSPDFRTTMYINVLEHPNNTAQNAQTPNAVGLSVMSMKLYNAWLSTLSFSDLDAGANAVGIQQMSIAYEGFDMHWGGGGYVANPVGW